ncbi:hypothetical protein HGM15179_016579 [Zosterops borbonicus]|uniref:Uncharacterized protein n=1 Tax=Zosterops borbonicus TaxID=364589 RepID=A0A8K1G2C7_9PASS|nr:hypothetical protein HGM15179_016579 [Zosterops borbonicus]
MKVKLQGKRVPIYGNSQDHVLNLSQCDSSHLASFTPTLFAATDKTVVDLDKIKLEAVLTPLQSMSAAEDLQLEAVLTPLQSMSAAEDLQVQETPPGALSWFGFLIIVTNQRLNLCTIPPLK